MCNEKLCYSQVSDRVYVWMSMYVVDDRYDRYDSMIEFFMIEYT